MLVVIVAVVVGGGAVPSDLMYITSVNPFIYSVWSWRKKAKYLGENRWWIVRLWWCFFFFSGSALVNGLNGYFYLAINYFLVQKPFFYSHTHTTEICWKKIK